MGVGNVPTIDVRLSDLAIKRGQRQYPWKDQDPKDENLLNQSFRSKESVVFLGKLLHRLLVIQPKGI